jgi:hypothetical protein
VDRRACSGTPARWGSRRRVDGGKRRELGEYLGIGTNNIAELTAIDRAWIWRARTASKKHLRISHGLGLLDRRAVEGLEGEGEPGADRAHAPPPRGLPHVEFVKVAGTPASPRTSAATSSATQAIRGGK